MYFNPFFPQKHLQHGSVMELSFFANKGKGKNNLKVDEELVWGWGVAEERAITEQEAVEKRKRLGRI